jgi:hypothetical protein
VSRFQYNYDADIGVDRQGRKNSINFQPVVPIALNPEWNLISRTILPIIDQQNVTAPGGVSSGRRSIARVSRSKATNDDQTEAVVAAIEITSAPKTRVVRSGIAGKIPKLEDDILKLAKLRRLARKREYVDSPLLAFKTAENEIKVMWPDLNLSFDLAPRAFLITCGDEWRKTKTFRSNLDAALSSAKQRDDEVWINAVLSVEHGMIWYKPRTYYESERREEHGLLEFILFLSKAISDYRTFRINIKRYRPTLPEQQEEGIEGSEASDACRGAGRWRVNLRRPVNEKET